MSTKNLLLNHLKVILGNHVEQDIVDYIHSMKHAEDLEEFMENILDKNNTSHVSSYEGICKVLFGKKSLSQNNTETHTSPKSPEKSNKGNKSNKGKKKFSDINSFKEKKKQQEGRTVCDCEGQEHEFMNNCLNCGRIHCYEEGPGPCFFCGEPNVSETQQNDEAAVVDKPVERPTKKTKTDKPRLAVEDLQNAVNLLQQPNDQEQVFGDYVASELRDLKNPENKRKLKRLINKAIMQISDMEDAERSELPYSTCSSTLTTYDYDYTGTSSHSASTSVLSPVEVEDYSSQQHTFYINNNN